MSELYKKEQFAELKQNIRDHLARLRDYHDHKENVLYLAIPAHATVFFKLVGSTGLTAFLCLLASVAIYFFINIQCLRFWAQSQKVAAWKNAVEQFPHASPSDFIPCRVSELGPRPRWLTIPTGRTQSREKRKLVSENKELPSILVKTIEAQHNLYIEWCKKEICKVLTSTDTIIHLASLILFVSTILYYIAIFFSLDWLAEY